jgi:DNA-binding NarL/FixJ family response regulator
MKPISTIDPRGSEDRPAAARIWITGDQGMVRTAMRCLVESLDGMTVVGDCENRPEALAEALHASPDLILLDLDLNTHGSGVLERVGALLGAANETPVLILTAADASHAVQFAMQHGVVGFVMKERPADVLDRAMHAVLAGEIWLERSMMASVMAAAVRPPVVEKRGGDSGIQALTGREREISELVALGLQNKAIAARLHISETTVRHHLTSIFVKLDVSNRLELMLLMFRGESRLVSSLSGLPAFAVSTASARVR